MGKSSLVNAVLGRRAAEVAKRPGKTRRIGRYETRDGALLADLPGYGFARAPEAAREAWRAEIESYLGGDRPPAGVVLVLDARVGPTDLDRALSRLSGRRRLPMLVVGNKVDALPAAERARAVARIREGLSLHPQAPVILVSARKGEGIAELRRALAEELSG